MLGYVLLCLILPLAGASILALGGRLIPRRAGEVMACATVAGSLGCAVSAWCMLVHSGQSEIVVHLVNWFEAAGLHVAANVLLDPLSAIMAIMVCFVSLIIHIHSVFFMRHDVEWARYFGLLNLFVFFMLVIVLADNIVFLFLGWEGVGFCSYALIGFWFTEVDRVIAGRKAFLVTRVGDVAFVAAIILLFTHFGRLGLSDITSHAAMVSTGMATLLGVLFLWAAVGKSAQLPLLVWLPDAMAGPTPVSALIHAATMVTAGVYLLMRLFPLLSVSPAALAAIAIVGAGTALFAACAALFQRDIKRVLAWSTISQVGYMFLGIGAGDPTGSFFQLLCHAFFKSLLFMTAGIVIQALGEEHDIFTMGKRTRKAALGVMWAFLCGAVALSGLPPFSGFFSKGHILMYTFGHPDTDYFGLWPILYIIGSIGALFTAIYTFRMFFVTFTGEATYTSHHKSEPVPGGMLHVLWPLALFALVAGALNLPESFAHLTGLPEHWLEKALHFTSSVEHEPHDIVEVIDGILAVTGLITAWAFFGPHRKQRIPLNTEQPGLPAWAFSGFGLDCLYTRWIAGSYVRASHALWRGADVHGVDAAANGLGALASACAGQVRRLSTGQVTGYVLWLLVGLTFVLLVLASVGIR
ncbi:NADH-quinone oxidoreductase subunit L [Desulfovibrio inopinatus]|uniref:NADH-quinone oxidoreductase subunit L n=1 Tax=Desulfovibrio inopinatus TaxID=102109 RepID=UPI000487CB53|nr:NADH-quinone oxidoreductase subunit L [Desulfovibrio inopinatus]